MKGLPTWKCGPERIHCSASLGNCVSRRMVASFCALVSCHISVGKYSSFRSPRWGHGGQTFQYRHYLVGMHSGQASLQRRCARFVIKSRKEIERFAIHPYNSLAMAVDVPVVVVILDTFDWSMACMVVATFNSLRGIEICYMIEVRFDDRNVAINIYFRRKELYDPHQQKVAVRYQT